jgi:hypothetical protein
MLPISTHATTKFESSKQARTDDDGWRGRLTAHGALLATERCFEIGWIAAIGDVGRFALEVQVRWRNAAGQPVALQVNEAQAGQIAEIRSAPNESVVIQLETSEIGEHAYLGWNCALAVINGTV